MYQMKILSVLALLTVLALLRETDGRPYRALSRQKRISDQRLAELETLIALSKMKSKMVTIPVGFGRVDPLKIGRRKRSVDELLKKLIADVTSQEKEEEVGSEEKDVLNQLFYDDSQRIVRHRHLPVRLPV